jgi:histidine triad (HIT) family protein
MTETACVFCAIVAGRAPGTVVYQDDRHVAFFPLEHMNPGHLVLIPKRHVDYVFDLEEDDYLALWKKAAQLAPGLQKVTAAKRVGILVEGYTVPHVHVHLVPTYAFNEIDAARQQRLPAAESERLANALRAVFKPNAAS